MRERRRRYIHDMKLLLIDDDGDLVALLTLALQRAGFVVVSAQDAPTAMALVNAERPDLVVIGVPLRATNALELLAQLRRQSRIAVIMLTGRGDEDDRVRGLELGADDYVSKPFSPRELVARIRGLLQHHDEDSPAAPTTFTIGSLTLAATTHTVTQGGRTLRLTVTEFRLLHCLMSHAGTVMSFATLLREVWGYDDPSVTDVVRTTVYRLRRKLQDDPTEPKLLVSVPGIGFLLTGEPPSTAESYA
jgi:DNA-binding response OmpR family regulator